MKKQEDARAVELRETIAQLRPRIDSQRERSSGRVRQVRSASRDLVFQGMAQAIGTLTAGAVAYLVAIAAGVLDGTRPLTILLSGILFVGFCASLYSARWFILPSKRAEMRLMSAGLELRQIEVRAKLRNGEALSVEDARLVATGLINLEGVEDDAEPSDA